MSNLKRILAEPHKIQRESIEFNRVRSRLSSMKLVRISEYRHAHKARQKAKPKEPTREVPQSKAAQLVQHHFQNILTLHVMEHLPPDERGLPFQLVRTLSEADRHPDTVPPGGTMFGELIRRFNDQSSKSGEHFTQHKVSRLMVRLLIKGDCAVLKRERSIRTVFDLDCDTLPRALVTAVISATKLASTSDSSRSYILGQTGTRNRSGQ